MKKKLVIRLLALSLCGVLAATSISAFAHENTKDTSAAETPALVSMLENPIISLTDGEEKTTKDETVYVLAGADGSVQKVIVSDWLKNGLGNSEIKDVTTLAGLETVKGDESFTTTQNGTVWNAQGQDVYYQGSTDQAMPIDVTVTYLLDGKPVTPQELKGKSGHVTIRYEYKNNQYAYVEINGKQEKAFVPFAMITGLLLDDEIFTNVEVTGGRLINEGSRTIVAGIAFPGLQENLGLDAEKFEIPSSLEIQADVKDFELGDVFLLATNEIFSRLNLDGVNSMEDLTEAMTSLQDAMDQLMDGSSKLSDGLKELLEKSGELSEGVTKLADGSYAIYQGTGQLNDGAGQLQSGAASLQSGASQLQNGVSQLQAGASQLKDGLNTLTSNNDSLNGGARQVFDTLLATASAQLNANGLSVPTMTAENYGAVLNGVIASLDSDAVYAKALQTVTDAVNAKKDLIVSGVTAAVRAQVEEGVTAAVRAQVTEKVTAATQAQVSRQVTAAMEALVRQQVTAAMETQVGADQMESEAVQSAIAAKTAEQMESEVAQGAIAAKTAEQMESETVKALIVSNVDAQMATDDIQSILQANIDVKMAEDTIQALIASNVEAQVQKAITDNMASPEVQQKLVAASEGAKSVISLKASLDNYNTFYCGLQAYTAGVAQAAAGAGQLSDGASQLTTGAGKLSAGAGQLSSGATSLKAGTQTLYDGTKQLNDGMNELKDSMPALLDGVKQLYDGSAALRDGLVTFNEEGIQKLVDVVDGDLDGFVNRLKATADLSKQYRNFSGISDDMDGQVKFVYRISGISK